MLVEVCLVDLYCVQKSVASNLAVDNVMFHVSRVIMIESYASFIEHDNGEIVEVNIDSWV